MGLMVAVSGRGQNATVRQIPHLVPEILYCRQHLVWQILYVSEKNNKAYSVIGIIKRNFIDMDEHCHGLIM